MNGNPNQNGQENKNGQPYNYGEHYRRQNEEYYGRPGPDFGHGGKQPYPPPVMQQNDPRAFSILAYVGVLWIVGLFADRGDPSVRFHVNQGIILSIFECAVAFVLGVVKAIIRLAFSFSLILSGIGTMIGGILSFAAWCFALIFSIIGIAHAAQGREEPLPFIGNLFTVIR